MMATMTQTISPSRLSGQGTVTTTFDERQPPRRLASSERGLGMTIRHSDDGTSLLVFGPIFKWVAGILSALIVAAVVSIVTMAMSVSAFSRDLQYMQQDLLTVKSSLLQLSADRYTGNQAAIDRSSMIELVKSNSADLHLIQQQMATMRERVSAIEANGRAK